MIKFLTYLFTHYRHNKTFPPFKQHIGKCHYLDNHNTYLPIQKWTKLKNIEKENFYIKICISFFHNWWMQLFSYFKLYNFVSVTSNHNPIKLVAWLSHLECQYRRFHFENTWLVEEDFAIVVSSSWADCSSALVLDKLKYYGVRLSKWQASRVGNLNHEFGRSRGKLLRYNVFMVVGIYWMSFRGSLTSSCTTGNLMKEAF